MSSRFFGPTQLRGLERIGDVLVPGDTRIPSFSRSGCVEHVDRLLGEMYEDDRRLLGMVLGVFAFTPRPLLSVGMRAVQAGMGWPGLLGAPMRMLDLAVKGSVMSLYWSDLGSGRLYEKMGYNPTVALTEADAAAAGAPVAARPDPEPLVAADASPARRAMTLARHGQRALRRTTMPERVRWLSRLRALILQRREEICDRIQADTGKSRSDALMSEVYGTLEALLWLETKGPAALADRKIHTPLALAGKTSWIWYQPLGTVLVISPWNYPFIQALIPIASALLTGNTVVYKPSEHTPLEGLLEDLLASAGIAPAWVQIVYGDGAVGSELIAERPDKVFFTGSTRTGRRIAAQAADLLVPVELELGGKDAMIVFADANVDRAAAGAVWGALTNTGQSCTSVERLYVQREAAEPLKAAIARELRRIECGVDVDGSTDIGHMTTDFQVEIVRRHVEDARARGAEILGGDGWDGVDRAVPPMLVCNVSDDMALLREETFGPLLPMQVFDTEEEAIARANDSEYGLTASVWSADLDRARRVARALETGGVSINNVMLTEGNPALPFGGVKNSGYGRHKGEHGLHGFCNVKSVLVDKDSAKIEANWYPYTPEKYRFFSRLLEALFGRRPWSLLGLPAAGLRLEHYADRVGREGRRSNR